MSVYVKNSSIWREITGASTASAVYVKVSNNWRPVEQLYIKQDGIWEPIFNFTRTLAKESNTVTLQVPAGVYSAEIHAVGSGGGGGAGFEVSAGGGGGGGGSGAYLGGDFQVYPLGSIEITINDGGEGAPAQMWWNGTSSQTTPNTNEVPPGSNGGDTIIKIKDADGDIKYTYTIGGGSGGDGAGDLATNNPNNAGLGGTGGIISYSSGAEARISNKIERNGIAGSDGSQPAGDNSNHTGGNGANSPNGKIDSSDPSTTPWGLGGLGVFQMPGENGGLYGAGGGGGGAQDRKTGDSRLNIEGGGNGSKGVVWVGWGN